MFAGDAQYRVFHQRAEVNIHLHFSYLELRADYRIGLPAACEWIVAVVHPQVYACAFAPQGEESAVLRRADIGESSHGIIKLVLAYRP